MDLEQRLAAAKRRMDVAAKALARKHQGGEEAEYWAAVTALLTAERELAAFRNEEHAVLLEFPVAWDFGAPLPQLLVNDHRAFLIFLRSTRDPDWDGSYATIADPASEHAEPLALVEFHRCLSAKLGSPNDEVFHGHPLEGKGLEGYRAQLVRNSRWIAELQRINSVHSGHRRERWADLQHFVFWFHDSTFECVAESFTVELHSCSMPALLAETCRRLVT